MLRSLVEKHGPKKWSTIASHINGRIGKQCRERWLNHLSPDVSKDVWTEEEDEILINAQFQMGNKWSFISKLLPGRSENAVKNRYNSIASRNGVRKKRLGTYVNRSAARSNLLRIPVQNKSDPPSEGISPRGVSPFPRSLVSSTSFDSTYSELLKKASEGARAPSARHSRRGGDAAQPAGVRHEDALHVFDDVAARRHGDARGQRAERPACDRRRIRDRDRLGAAHRGQKLFL